MLYTSSMFAKILIGIGITAAVALSYMLVSTPPVEAGASGVLIVFLLSYILSVVVLAFLIFLSHRFVLRLLYSDRTGKAGQQFGLRKSYYYASILALGPVILISLRSVGQDGIVQLALVLILLAAGCLYISRQTS
jgi:nitrogen fixation/metabolism regulation signal transduction histidine kinase